MVDTQSPDHVELARLFASRDKVLAAFAEHVESGTDHSKSEKKFVDAVHNFEDDMARNPKMVVNEIAVTDLLTSLGHDLKELEEKSLKAAPNSETDYNLKALNEKGMAAWEEIANRKIELMGGTSDHSPSLDQVIKAQNIKRENFLKLQDKENSILYHFDQHVAKGSSDEATKQTFEESVLKFKADMEKLSDPNRFMIAERLAKELGQRAQNLSNAAQDADSKGDAKSALNLHTLTREGSSASYDIELQSDDLNIKSMDKAIATLKSSGVMHNAGAPESSHPSTTPTTPDKMRQKVEEKRMSKNDPQF